MNTEPTSATPRDGASSVQSPTVSRPTRVTGSLRGAGARPPLFWKLMLVAMALMWGFSFVVVKDALSAVPTFFLLACRFLGAAALMALLFWRRIADQLNRRTIAVGAVMGIFMGVAYAFQTLGLLDTTPGKNAFLTGVYCVLVPFVSYLMAREPLTRFNVGAALLCVAGIALVALDNLSIGVGDVLTLAGALFFALQIAVASHYGRDLDVNVSTFWMFLTVGALSLVATLALEPASVAAIPWSGGLVGTLVFLSVCCTCLGLLVQNLALAHVPASTGSLLLSLESPSGVLFSALLGGEVLTFRLLAGFALIFCSIVVSETRLAFLVRDRR